MLLHKKNSLFRGLSACTEAENPFQCSFFSSFKTSSWTLDGLPEWTRWKMNFKLLNCALFAKVKWVCSYCLCSVTWQAQTFNPRNDPLWQYPKTPNIFACKLPWLWLFIVGMMVVIVGKIVKTETVIKRRFIFFESSVDLV